MASISDVLGLTPAVAVSSSPQADAICARTGLRHVAELLRPFGDETATTPLTVTTTGEPYHVEGLRLRLCAAGEMRPMDPEVSEQRIKQCVAAFDSEALWHCSPPGSPNPVRDNANVMEDTLSALGHAVSPLPPREGAPHGAGQGGP